MALALAFCHLLAMWTSIDRVLIEGTDPDEMVDRQLTVWDLGGELGNSFWNSLQINTAIAGHSAA